MSDLVSIIIPSYNHEKYIADCIYSIYDQSYENIELILIDDCSTDKTFEIASKLLSHAAMQKRFHRIVLKKKEKNSGAHDSINIGLSIAQGEFIGIINSDDVYHKDRISIMIEEMKQHKADFAFSRIAFFYSSLEKDELPSNLDVPDSLYSYPLKQICLADAEPSIGFALLRENIAVSTGNFLFRRRILDYLGGFISLRYSHDWDFILRSLLITEPLFVKKTLYYYRLHEVNTFKEVKPLAFIETEVVLRRFFRAISTYKPLNPLCPSPENWPGYFQIFIKRQGYQSFWVRESGGKEPYWRVYDKKEQTGSFVEVLRRLYNRLRLKNED
ncbi:MAG: glycosyltransferase [Candidatus Omnitrophica bacterium]|nr:glycosyltransferase [Candidatus Omnitrophota bacterium]